MDQPFRSARKIFSAALVGGGFILQLAASGAPLVASGEYHYYVSPEGADTNSGTKVSPFKTIQRAATMALPGTTIHVAAGTYPGGFKTAVSGNASGRIVFVSTARWGAKIVPPAGSANHTAWENRGSHVDIVGFDIDGSGTYTGIRWLHGIYNGGSFNSIRNNHVHDIAQAAPCAGAGSSGIGVDSYYHGVQVDVIGNNVHHIGPDGCRYTKGIYLNTSANVKNNVVYSIGGAAIQLWHDAANVVIANNTVAGSNSGIVVGGGDYYYTKGPNDYTSVHNNIVYDNKYGITEQGATGLNNTYRNNLVFQNATANWELRNGLTHSGTVSAPPQFVHYAKNGVPDFHLQSNSPAIGKALPEHAHFADYDGKVRRKSTGYDIGAYQR